MADITSLPIQTKLISELTNIASPLGTAVLEAEQAGVSGNITLEQIKAFIFQESHRIGEPFYIWDHLTSAEIPDNSSTAKYVRLTAGLGGAGGYNQGLLINESVSGAGPLVEATAEIAVGPMAGQVIPLLNTERALLRAGGNSGALEFDQMQTHRHRFLSPHANGAIDSATATGITVTAGGSLNRNHFTQLLNTADDEIRTGDRTRDKARIITGYLRIL